MKIKPSSLRISINYLIGFIIVGVLIFLSFMNTFLSSWGVLQITIVGVYVLGGTVLYYLTIKTTFYYIEKHSFSFFRWGKELRYSYKDILYIDTSKGNKTNTLTFYTTKGHTIYLTTDKKGKLYDEVIKKCDSILTREELLRRYPKAKI